MKRYILAAVKPVTDEAYATQRSLAETSNRPSILSQLAESADSGIRGKVALNPDTPLDVLLKLAKDPEFSVKSKLLDRRNVPDDVILALMEDESPYIVNHTLETITAGYDDKLEIKAGDAVYVQLARSKNAKVRQRLAYCAPYMDLPLEAEKILAADEDYRIRGDVVRYREHIPLELVDMLKNDSNYTVRYAIVRDAGLPHDYYEEFVHDPEFKVRRALVLNPLTPTDILEEMTHDPCDDIVLLAESKLARRERGED